MDALVSRRSSRRARAVLHAEELDAAIAELLDYGRERGERLRALGGGEREPLTPSPDVSPLLAEELRSALEDEVVPAVETEANSGIVQWELDRELAKKALVGLKLPMLRELARERSLETTGGSEELAARIARAYRWDEEAIARLVLEHEPEPTPERGHVDRLFPLGEVPNLDVVERRLGYVAGRYIRVGVARWFVFEDATITDQSITVTGTVRAYRASVDTLAEEPALAATPSEASAELMVRSDHPFLVARRCSAQVARAAVKALRTAVGVRPVGQIAYGRGPLEGAAARFASESLFTLDVLANRVRQAGFAPPNLTVARFKVGETPVEVDTEDEVVRRPALRAVRFEGEHLLDSAVACKLLAEEGRALVDVAMRIDVATEDASTTAAFSARLALEADHALVMTSFGTRRPELSVRVQRALVDAVGTELKDGFADRSRLAQLCERILERARSEVPVTRADLLNDEAASADEADEPVL